MRPLASEPPVAIITPCAMRPFLNSEVLAAKRIFVGARGSEGDLYRKATRGEALVEAGKFLIVPGDHEGRQARCATIGFTQQRTGRVERAILYT
jgi:hypothetical protein